MKMPRNIQIEIWLRWLAAIAVLIFIGHMAGCVMVHVEKEMPDGTKIYATYERWFAPQKLDGVIIDLDTGKASIVKQESDTVALATGIAEGVAKGITEGANPLK